MKRSIHHIELNERLQICFDQLDKITRQYRDYNQHYIQIVNDHPGQTEELFNSFEKSVLKNFKMYDESKREEILALLSERQPSVKPNWKRKRWPSSRPNRRRKRPKLPRTPRRHPSQREKLLNQRKEANQGTGPSLTYPNLKCQKSKFSKLSAATPTLWSELWMRSRLLYIHQPQLKLS